MWYVIVHRIFADWITHTLSEDVREIIIDKLGAYYPCSEVTRLSRMPEVNSKMHPFGWKHRQVSLFLDPRLLAVALRVVMTLARIPECKHS